MKAEIKKVEREIVTTTKVMEEVVQLNLTKGEFAVLQDVLCAARRTYLHNSASDAAARAYTMFCKVQGGVPGNNNPWWYNNLPFDTCFKD